MTMHDEVELEDMDWNEELQAFTYQCPCGDFFQITLDELAAGRPRGGGTGQGRSRQPHGSAVSCSRRRRPHRLPALRAHTLAGEEVAKCPSCSLYVKVIYDPQDFQEALEPSA